MSDVRWEGYSHEEIYARVQQGPGRLASSDAETAWSTVESTIRTVDAQLTRAVNRIGAGWQGRAADAVHGGMTVMSNWALDAAGDATLTRNGITAQAEQAARLRTAMPPPRTDEWNRMVHEEVPAVGLMSATGDLGALEERMANDRAMAVDLMNRYSSQSSDNQRMMNYWTQPPTVVVEAVAPASSSAAAQAGGVVGALGVIGAAGAAATARRIGAGPGERDGEVGSGAPGAFSEAPVVAGGTTSPRRDAVPSVGGVGPAAVDPGPVAVPGGAGPTGTAAPGTATPRTATPGTAPPSSSTTPGSRPASRPVPSVVGRPPVASTPAVPRAPGVRPVVPGPPAQAGSTDWRTGLRAAPDAPGRPVRPILPEAVAEPLPRPVATTTEGAGRGSGGHGFLPMGGAARPVDQEHRRATYLVDDTDAFADDRWFPPPVIGADLQASRA